MAEQEEDLYLVLGLEKGLESTEAEVKKAYRKKALESHPDKRPDEKNAAAEFDRIQKAYDVLSDAKARKAYDDLRRVQRARQESDAQKGAKRQKMMHDLKKREEAFHHERSAEEMAKMKLKAEIARVRQESIARQKRQQEELAAAQEEARRGSGASASASAMLLDETTLARTLKATWDRFGGSDEYGAAKLRKIFSAFGPVEEIIIHEDVKKKKKGSALVVLKTENAAAKAMGAVCGDLSNPLLVKPAVPGLVPREGGVDGAQPSGVDGAKAGGANRAQEGNHVDQTKEPGQQADDEQSNQNGEKGDAHTQKELSKATNGTRNERPNIFANGPPRPVFGGTSSQTVGDTLKPLFGGAAQASALSGAAAVATSGSHKDYENVTLLRMRQAAERARLIREMEEQDAQEAAAEKIET